MNWQQSANYQRFVAESAKHCDCDPPYCPCDGVLAGGMCDDLHADEEYEYDDAYCICGDPWCGGELCHGDCDEAEGWE